MSRRVAGVPGNFIDLFICIFICLFISFFSLFLFILDAMGGSFSETFCLPNKCVDPLIMNSYIARKDRFFFFFFFFH